MQLEVNQRCGESNESLQTMLTCHQALFISCMEKITDDDKKYAYLYIPPQVQLRNTNSTVRVTNPNPSLLRQRLFSGLALLRHKPVYSAGFNTCLLTEQDVLAYLDPIGKTKAMLSQLSILEKILLSHYMGVGVFKRERESQRPFL